MSLPAIEAHIETLDGTYYPVLLHCIPHVGDQIELNSRLNAKSGHTSVLHYDVVGVRHLVADQIEKPEPHQVAGNHFIKIFVKEVPF